VQTFLTIDASDRMVTLASVARQLNHTTNTLVRWSKAGRFPPFVVQGNRKYCREADVRVWLQDRRQPFE
jgi:predicted site-specific integrase-resolvase